jgi:hypothetical protein
MSNIILHYLTIFHIILHCLPHTLHNIQYEYSAKGRPVTLPGVKGRNLDNLPVQTEILVLPPNYSAGPVEMINYSGIQHLGGFDPLAAVSNVAGNNYANGTLAYKKGYANYV